MPPTASNDYKREKLMIGLDVLITGTGRLQKRLETAWLSVASGHLNADDFSDAERYLFERIDTALTKLSSPERGALAASTEAMDDSTAKAAATDLLELFRRVFGIWD